MPPRPLLPVLAAALALAAALPAAAHHSFAMFDSGRTLTLNGTVKTFEWINPHAVIWLAVGEAGDAEPVLWAIEMTSPGNLRREGWNRETLKPGDLVEAVVNPLRDGGPGGGFYSLKILATGREFTRVRTTPPPE